MGQYYYVIIGTHILSRSPHIHFQHNAPPQPRHADGGRLHHSRKSIEPFIDIAHLALRRQRQVPPCVSRCGPGTVSKCIPLMAPWLSLPFSWQGQDWCACMRRLFPRLADALFGGPPDDGACDARGMPHDSTRNPCLMLQCDADRALIERTQVSHVGRVLRICHPSSSSSSSPKRHAVPLTRIQRSLSHDGQSPSTT